MNLLSRVLCKVFCTQQVVCACANCNEMYACFVRFATVAIYTTMHNRAKTGQIIRYGKKKKIKKRMSKDC